jgi:hypothetical protein
MAISAAENPDPNGMVVRSSDVSRPMAIDQADDRVEGSLLSIGVALMGQARGVYTFSSLLRWALASALGYAASIFAYIYLSSAHLNQCTTFIRRSCLL